MSEKTSEESLLKNWSEAQQKLLTDWLDTLRKLGGTSALELWSKTVDAWQASVKETADARAEWTRQWTEKLAHTKGTPEEMRELARQGREELQHWAEAERDLWQGWFNIVRGINFKPEQGAGAHLRNDLVQFWQDSAHKMIDAQAAFIRRLTGGGTTAAKTHGSPAEKKHDSPAAKTHDGVAAKKHE